MRMKRRFGRWSALLIAVLCCFLITAYSLADAGNFSGDSDWGGGGSDWGSSSSDWGSSDWSSSGSTWSSGTTDSGSSDGSSSGGCLGANLFTVVLVVIILIVFSRFRKTKKSGKGGASVYRAAEAQPGLPLDELKKKDPNFNEQAFLEKIGNDYMQMQDAWESRKWEPMRAIMTDALYNQMARQLQELVNAGRTNHIERIAVLETRIVRYAVEGDDDVLVVRLSTRICDYTTDDRTGEVVSGSKTRELFMVYEWKMTRQKDQLTQDEAEMTQVSCPNCGAPLEINQTGKCPYCGSVVTLAKHDWALSSIKGISQRSVN